MKLSRDWATPLTIGAFALMAVTGVLMFFHLDSGLNKLAHEWLSWIMIGGVVLHAAANWSALKRHVLANPTGRAILVLSALVVVGSFAPLGGRPDNGGNPPMLALRAVMQAPLTALAPLKGRSAQALLLELRAKGIVLASEEQSLASVLGGSREREALALNVLFNVH